MQSRNQQNGFRNFNNENSFSGQNGTNNGFMFQNSQSQFVNGNLKCGTHDSQNGTFCNYSNETMVHRDLTDLAALQAFAAVSKRNAQQQSNRKLDNVMESSNDATFGQNQFNSIYAQKTVHSKKRLLSIKFQETEILIKRRNSILRF